MAVSGLISVNIGRYLHLVTSEGRVKNSNIQFVRCKTLSYSIMPTFEIILFILYYNYR